KYEISIPNILRIEHTYYPNLSLDLSAVKTLELDAYETATRADLAPILEGKPDITKLTQIDLEELGKKYRLQKIVFDTARDVFDQMKPNWKGRKEILLAQLMRIVHDFISSDAIQIHPPQFNKDELRRRILVTLNMTKIVQHIWEAIR
ncbi:MAG: type III restriction endonuclease subunit R, partial [Aliifodinibius sp.]|nr:type III restriction endonuclease subunit R [candidate division Zixibacteria bacterium]NIT61096.1 type III restriction endonuclease subunit R [Fodinibius sp.]NIV08801.1 type III restriction endonuclease subunit R [candidate division Zixibacteria bacterium]NIY29676.1 type III restriction endonuclease subunit R [Fodinibius sp.]